MKEKIQIFNSILINSSFNQSLYEHQLFIDVLLSNISPDGLTYLSQSQIAKQLGKSQSLIGRYINQLNRVDKCITKINRGVYKLHYSDIKNNGVFPIIRRSLTLVMLNSQYYLNLNNKEKALFLGIDVNLVPVIEAYFFMDLK